MRREIALIAIAAVALSVAFVGYYFLTRVEYKTYVNENYSFKFDYPADWGLHEEKKDMTLEGRHWVLDVSALSPRPPLEEHIPYYGGSLTVSVIETDESLDNIRGTLENTTDILIDGIPAFRQSAEGQIGPDIHLKIDAIVAIKDNFLYSFWMGAQIEKYSDYEQIFKHMLDSFSIF